MAGKQSEGMELFVSPKDIQRGRRRRPGRPHAGYQSEGGAGAAAASEWHDTSSQTTNEELLDTYTYLSDHGLPSERARIAASNRYRELQRSGEQENFASTERTPLLGSQMKETVLGATLEPGTPVLVRVEPAEEKMTDGIADSLAHETLVQHKTNDVRGGGGESVRDERKRLKREKYYRVGRFLRVAVLTSILLVSMILFSINDEPVSMLQIVTAASNTTMSLTFPDSEDWEHAVLSLNGPFKDVSFRNGTEDSCEDFLCFCSPHIEEGLTCEETCSSDHCHSVRVVNFNLSDPPFFQSSDVINRDIQISRGDRGGQFELGFLCVHDISFEVSVRGELLSNGMQVVVATSILVGVYLLIIFDIVHRTLAAFIGSTATIAALSMLQKRPTFYEVVEWVDLDTISLLFGMMTLVAIFSQTGFFDYSAVKAYKLAKGKIGPLITILCLLSAVVSAFLDNVTTILLLTPVSIRLCQVLNVDPLPVLIAEVVFSNIGGTATAVGDPPNIIIVSNRLIRSQGIDFAEFTLHLSLGILLCMGVAFAVLACIYCTCVRLPNKDRPHIAELKREMAIWERTALQMPVVSLEETAVRDALRTKANEVRNQLRREELLSVQSATDMWQTNLAQLEKQYRITDPVLLVKSASVLVVVILLFFLASVIPGVELELGWIAIFGAVVLLILADTQDLDPILHKIEWSTLLFFAGLFVLMEGLQELGLIQYIGDQMVRMITMVPPENQMVVALILVVWVSALASSFIDNIPFTTATIPVIVELAESPELCLSLRPLVWALAFGACLGGNGTLIGASANVVCAGIAEQNGYKISFVKFFIIGFPMMLATTMTAMIYLLISHEALQWNIDSSCSSS